MTEYKINNGKPIGKTQRKLPSSMRENTVEDTTNTNLFVTCQKMTLLAT